MEVIIVHYAEIGTKGKNRPWFEKLLVENIATRLSGMNYTKIKRVFGRIIITLPPPSLRMRGKTTRPAFKGCLAFPTSVLPFPLHRRWTLSNTLCPHSLSMIRAEA